MKQFRALRVVLCASLLLGGRLGGQVLQGSAAKSPIDDLLTKAQQAFNDLNYARADSIARQVLGAGARTTEAQHTKALLVIAAAYYPEEQSAQKKDQAIATLKQIIRTNMDIKIPQDLTWPGLDSLLVATKRTTFGVSVQTDSSQTTTGPSGAGEVRVRGNHPASFRLTIAPTGGGAPIVTDSIDNVTTGTLHFATMRNERPIFTTGDYDLIVTAMDPQTNDTSTTRFLAHVTAPELTFAKIPVSIDSSRLLPEHTSKYGVKGIIVGALVAGGIYSFSNTLHADTTLKSKVGADSKGTGIALAAGAAIIIASYMDHGRRIPGAMVANAKLHTDLAESIRAAESENAGRITSYSTIIVIQSGAR